MTITFGLVFLFLLGIGLIVGALSARRLIAWENRTLTSLADTLRGWRVALEEEQHLLEPELAPVAISVAAPRQSTHDRAA